MERHQELIEANTQAISALRENRYISLWLDVDSQSVENEYIRLYRGRASNGNPSVNWSIKSGWVGSFQVVAGALMVDGTAFNERIYMRELMFQILNSLASRPLRLALSYAPLLSNPARRRGKHFPFLTRLSSAAGRHYNRGRYRGIRTLPLRLG